MGIKKIVVSEDIELTLTRDSGLFIFDTSGEKIKLLIDNVEAVEFEKLKRFKEISEFKFIGGEKVFDSFLKTNLSWPKPSRKKIVLTSTKVILDAKTGKVRFESKGHERSALASSSTVEGELNKKKVLIIDDSKTIQKLLKRIVESSDKLEVYGVANCPSEAKSLIENEKPDLITLDIHMPEMNGVEFLKQYISHLKIPTIMISSVSVNEGPLVMEALASGAQTYIKKPSVGKMNEVAPDIIEKLESIANLKTRTMKLKTEKQVHGFEYQDGIIFIGSSTGGTQALQEIFTSLPSNIPPILVVQHIPAVFSKALAERLDTLCPFTVKEAENNEVIKSNTIYIAPGDFQMKIERYGKQFKVVVNDDPPVNRFKPSVDYLFNSVADVKIKNKLGIILTGMGRDGAKGLLKLKELGAYTIAQDEESSVVFGMPKEAIALGAAQKIVSLDNMAEEMITNFNKLESKKSA